MQAGLPRNSAIDAQGNVHVVSTLFHGPYQGTNYPSFPPTLEPLAQLPLHNVNLLASWPHYIVVNE